MTQSVAHYRTGRVASFELPGGDADPHLDSSEVARCIHGPGFVDLQCNGFAGIDFNHPDTTPEHVCEAVRAMWRHGCTSVLPTVITAAPERIEHLLRTLVRARNLDRDVRESIPGFHLEGPFISGEDGARGAHPAAHVCRVEPTLWARFQRAAAGLIRLVTLAPEVDGALPFIGQLCREDVIPAIGHTLANAEQISAAADAGALLSTHLGNGCPQQIHRHANTLFPQLAESRLTASLIADGAHLPPDVVRFFYQVKGRTRTILVTDAMAAAGAPPGRYTIGDLTLEVGRDRIARQPGQPNLAGSALAMDEAVARFITDAGATLPDAWDCASLRPRKLLRLRPTRDVVLVETRTSSLRVLGTWRRGRLLALGTS